ncbi:hypothetical protein LOZ39_003407 [Ophidiomyces ophidiicola]|uniref:uncharacterized protein n=1 Tax=Ophidiomyces ophidiicola TaxID=1387563 RepID=UPI0020C2E17D|nr:uncharacterized protein LOZ57_006156 [Ophidiomyces ophidiicola]KAI1939196.1 hypothetical protein LOZ57_006156 [Ophidiomyces ophidiicola]KAI2004891.1 hypothetical protein LOZ49_005667 [Ophidiomyces ophidiicola]KAI2058076.1 hypothetical protein LOZ43_002726 [Ophidiomyces ophidiicola]KAI2075212.1 hypothetical protein LOZ39_003407 [Ophidiomyces ophidiicola]KAI2086775.1 hypothetical protein LOZ36_003108 [Ophidiomyces ophidiicola]
MFSTSSFHCPTQVFHTPPDLKNLPLNHGQQQCSDDPPPSSPHNTPQPPTLPQISNDSNQENTEETTFLGHVLAGSSVINARGNGNYLLNKLKEDLNGVRKHCLMTAQTLGAQWKYEEPRQPEPSTESKSEPDSPFYLGKSLREPKKRKQKPPKSVSEKQRAAHERDTAASQPYYLLAQVSLEREWIVDDLSGVVDIDTQTHINVKNRWVEQGIWNSSWTDVPGLKWMHEDEREDSNSLVANS